MIRAQAAAYPAVPRPLTLGPLLRIASAAAVLLGAGAFTWALQTGHEALAWSSYLIGVFFALGLGAFGVMWVAILYLSGANWSVTMRRIPEAMTAWLLPGGLLAGAVAVGAPVLYLWADSHGAAQDALLRHKAPFLNLPMFVTLVGASLASWAACAAVIVGRSYRQDGDGAIRHTRANRAASALFAVLFAVTFSIVSFYLLLSLDAHWFSTMFAVMTFTDVMQTGTAFTAVVVSALLLAGRFEGFVNENHLHGLGKMVFAWTGFWAYIYFCQFMLIWYANIPEETAYFLRRSSNGWLPYLLALPLIKFGVPFLLLLPRSAKRNPRTLLAVSCLVLLAQFWELFVMVGPAIGHGEEAAHAHLPLVEFAVTLGFLGAFTLVFGRALAGHDAVPSRDPGIADCLHYHS